MKQRQHQSSGQSKQHKLTKAVTHIMLGEINSGKLATLDELAQVYLALCQQYITLFCTDEHPEAQIAYEQLSVASMKYKARAMNAYLRASNLAHIPRKIAWEASKRGMEAICVKSAYSSQECSMCHYPDRANRPDQQTFCCVVCGFSTHADHNAAMNLARRSGDRELHACQDRQEIKALLLKRHKQWRTQKGWS